MKKVILLLSVLAVIAVGWFLYFHKGEPLADVGLYEVDYGNLENALEFSGEVVCTNMYSVMSETGGTVAGLYVSEGRQVTIGESLFDLDGTAVEAQLEEARLRYDALSETAAQAVMAQQGSGTASAQQQKAAVALALSQTTGYDYDSLNDIFGSGAGEQAAAAAATMAERLSELGDVDASADAALDTDSQLKLAALAVEQLETALEKLSFRSRINGTVLAVNVNRGEVLSPGVPAMVIADTESKAITGYVYEKDVDGLSLDMAVKITTGDGSYTGKISRIGNAAADVGEASAFDTMTKVQITPDGTFDKMPGAVVDLKIVLSSKKNVLTVPVDCLTNDGCVYVVGEDDAVEKRAVITGFEDSFNVEIVEGLSRGERIVTSPQDVEEGQHVSYDRGE